MTMVAVVWFLAGLTFVAGCGRTITAPEPGMCPRGTVMLRADTVRSADTTAVLATAAWCVKEGA
ncbi:MAG: hypothetical protein ACO3QC_11695 [Phycisphaerales bacterium]